MKPTAGQEQAALILFAKLHPVHSAPGKDAYPVTAHPSPTTDHLRVQCGCGYGWRYSGRDLIDPLRPGEVDIDFRRGARSLK